MKGQPDRPPDETVVDLPLVTEQGAEAPAPLSKRLRDPRTIISIVLPLILIALIALTVGEIDLDELVGSITGADPLLLLAAFGMYYLGFPLRGYRWALLLRGAGMRVSLRDSTEIIFIGWLVNCLVPAKLGDVYRAYLLRLNFDVSLSRTFGTVFIERIFDLFTIVLLGLAAGFWSFRDGMSPEVRIIFGIGLAFVAALAIGLFVVRNFGRRIITRLPLPKRAVEFYERFEEGVFSIEARRVPLLAVVTVLIWATEAMRLYLVVLALGFEFPLGISGAFFVALIASLLTAIPLTPAGLGIVEAGVASILVGLYQATGGEAAAIVLVDRAISVLSVIALGSIVYLVSTKTRGSTPRPGS
ncbi:MAG: flippase-like domain-containing protein [Chloroflexota bacterium]|nr:flippase-like domain-containing protein [Chloroflexota bacterium]